MSCALLEKVSLASIVEVEAVTLLPSVGTVNVAYTACTISTVVFIIPTILLIPPNKVLMNSMSLWKAFLLESKSLQYY